MSHVMLGNKSGVMKIMRNKFPSTAWHCANHQPVPQQNQFQVSRDLKILLMSFISYIIHTPKNSRQLKVCAKFLAIMLPNLAELQACDM
jgi:hypothetical protein